MRDIVDALLLADVELQNLGIVENTVFSTAAVPTFEIRPFLVQRWGIRTSSIVRHGPVSLTIWTYDSGSDYTKLDKIQARVKDVLEGAVHVKGIDSTITSIQWQEDSPDLYDDQYDAIVKYSTFRVLGRAT